MKRLHKLRHRWSAPLVYLAALLLMLEDWLWDLGARLTRGLAQWPPLRRLESWICALRPAAALAIFVLPALLLMPVKLLALFAIARGHIVSGVLVVLTAKLLGAAAVARLYLLTRPVLLTIPWFAALLNWFLALKARWIARLHASWAWHDMRALLRLLGRWRRALWSGLRRKFRAKEESLRED